VEKAKDLNEIKRGDFAILMFGIKLVERRCEARKQRARERSRARYLANAVELNRIFLYEYCEGIILKARKEFPEEMEAGYKSYPFESCVIKRMNRLLGKFHIFKNQYLYDDCVSICSIAYLYSVSQCVIHKYLYFKGYINKMLPIFIKCQMRLSIDKKARECNYDDAYRYNRM